MNTLLPLITLLAVGYHSAPPNVALTQQDPRYKPQRLHQLKDLETRKMVVNGHTLTIWLMDNSSKRQEGMMWLEKKDVKDTEGMLFVFSRASEQGFWMQNCPLSLDISYISP